MKGIAMFSKKKFASAKDKIKKNVPLVVAVSTSIVAIATSIHYKHKSSKCEGCLSCSNEDLEAMKTGDVGMEYVIDGCTYLLRHIGPDHK